MEAKQTISEQPAMTKAEAIRRLMEDLEKGRSSGEEVGWFTVEEVRAHFEERARNELK